MTMAMLERYNSENMAEWRNTAWKRLYSDDRETEPIYIDARNDGDAKRESDLRAISEIQHFWYDFSRLLKANALDKSLAEALFSSPWQDTWLPLLRSLQYGDEETGNSDPKAERFNEWKQKYLTVLNENFPGKKGIKTKT